jgi:hypothetical protein
VTYAAPQILRGLQRRRNGRLALLRAILDAFGEDDLRGHPDEREGRAQVGFDMFARREGRLRAVEPSTRDRDDDAHVFCQALDPFFAISKGLARNEDAVDPGLQLARDGEIIYRRADHDDVGRKELLERIPACRHGVAKRSRVRAFCQSGERMLARQMLQRQMRQRESGEVAIRYPEARVGTSQLIHDRGGHLPADGIFAEDA